jgi:anti-sigma regulatory factor (Ser/Thr protein kinase)
VRELSLHVLDILQNSLEAGASRIELIVEEDLTQDLLSVTVIDNGRGMDASQLVRAADPFFTTRKTRHVGLGLPLLASAAEHCGGGLKIESELGVGTKVVATFKHSHIDRAPLGNIRDSLLAFVMSGSFEPASDFYYRHKVNDREFEFNTADVRHELEGVPLSHRMVREWLGEFISEGERDLYQ